MSRRCQITSNVFVSMHAVPDDPNVMYTRPSSITGVGEAAVLNGCTNCGCGTSNSFQTRTTFPLSLSMQSTNNCRPSLLAEVSHTCFPYTTGDDQPRS